MHRLYAIFVSVVITAAVFLTGLLPEVIGRTDEAGEIPERVAENETPQRTIPLTVLFFGDMMLDRHVALKMDRYGNEYPFLYTRELFKSADFLVANAEGVFSDNTSITKGTSDAPLRFTFATSTLPLLSDLGFSAFSQANNHNADFDREASIFSRQSIERAGIKVFGDYWNEEVGPVYLEKHKQKIALIGFNEFSYRGIENIDKAIMMAKKEGAYVVVFPHWGIEYSRGVSKGQQTYAHRFIDSGADLIVGAHPHVIEPIELYKGKIIFYSLGNFIFDQYQPHTQEALGLKLELSASSSNFTLIPLSLSIGQAKVAEIDEREALFRFLSTATSTSDSLRGGVAEGLFSFPR